MKKTARILMIEDEPGFVRIYKDLLVSEGFEVLQAEDGEKGWNIVEKEKPDLVLLDLILPKLSGLEVLKKIRTTPTTKDIPVIIFSVLGEQKNIDEGLQLGANDYTVKGFYTPKEILIKVRALLDKPQTQSKHIESYTLLLAPDAADAHKLQEDIGLNANFICPHCSKSLSLELIPDYSNVKAHWFSAHFMCSSCKREF
jgi:DNA-binding response OmpR family regulator